MLMLLLLVQAATALSLPGDAAPFLLLLLPAQGGNISCPRRCAVPTARGMTYHDTS